LMGWRPKKDDIESAKAAFDDHIRRMEAGG
jgi:hypothetical protein